MDPKADQNRRQDKEEHKASWRHKELEGDITQHQTEATNWQDKTSGRAEAKYTDTDDETRNRWAGAAGEMTEGNHRGNNSGR